MTARDPSDPSGQLAAARDALSVAGDPIPAAEVPNAAGLYAIFGDARAWRDLRLGAPPDARPLYIGKAELSLIARDVKKHFVTGRTASSTLRRSFAGLLRQTLDLGLTRAGLTREADDRLTRWMHERLRIAAWPSPPGAQLVDIQRALLGEWLPPLNFKDVTTPWTDAVKQARRALRPA